MDARRQPRPCLRSSSVMRRISTATRSSPGAAGSSALDDDGGSTSRRRLADFSRRPRPQPRRYQRRDGDDPEDGCNGADYQPDDEPDRHDRHEQEHHDCQHASEHHSITSPWCRRLGRSTRHAREAAGDRRERRYRTSTARGDDTGRDDPEEAAASGALPSRSTATVSTRPAGTAGARPARPGRRGPAADALPHGRSGGRRPWRCARGRRHRGPAGRRVPGRACAHPGRQVVAGHRSGARSRRRRCRTA